MTFDLYRKVGCRLSLFFWLTREMYKSNRNWTWNHILENLINVSVLVCPFNESGVHLRVLDFHCKAKQSKCSSKHLLCSTKGKDTQVWNDIRLSKWCQDFLHNYPFNKPRKITLRLHFYFPPAQRWTQWDALWHWYAQAKENSTIMNRLIQEIHMVYNSMERTPSSPATIQSTHVLLSWNAIGIKTRSTAWAVWSAGVWMQPAAIRSKVCHSKQQETGKVIALMLIVIYI